MQSLTLSVIVKLTIKMEVNYMRIISKEYAELRNAVQVGRVLRNGSWLPIVIIGSKKYIVGG